MNAPITPNSLFTAASPSPDGAIDFSRIGRQLLANGYIIIPIRKGAKSPAISGWQRARLTASELDQYPGHGVGVVTGQGAYPIVGIDIDISHPVIGPALVQWCRDNLGYGSERIGAAPRILLVYRATGPGWAKGSSAAFFDPNDPVKPSGKRNEQMVEILGFGQQFVAYHIHPDTGLPYAWTDAFEGLTNTKAAELPVISESHIRRLMMEVDRLMQAQRKAQPELQIVSQGEYTSVPVSEIGGMGVGGGAGTGGGMVAGLEMLSTISPPLGKTLDEAREYLNHLSNQLSGSVDPFTGEITPGGGVDFDTWLHVGMALHHEFSGSDAALALWNEWSSKSDKHVPGEAERRWHSFSQQRGHGGRVTTMRWLIKIANQEKQDTLIDGMRQALTDVKGWIDRAEDTTDLTTKILAKIKPLIPDEQAARAEVIGYFQQKFKALSGVLLPVADARRLLGGRAVGGVEKLDVGRAKRPLTEFGNAERMLDRYGQGLMFVPELERWFAWTGIYWRKVSTVEIEHYAKETVRALIDEYDDHADDDAGAFFEFCKVSQRAQMVKNMLLLARCDPRVLVPAKELDKHKHLIGVKNGVVDLRTGVLMEPDPELRITVVAGAEYSPGARCPIFEKVVSDAFFGDIDQCEFFMRLIGYTMMGDPTEDILVIPFGNGSNGKSTILGAIRKAFGGYAKSADASTFVSSNDKGNSNAGGPREDLLRLRGARFVYVTEPDENSELKEGTIKSLTGGDVIPARGVNAKDSIEIDPSWVAYMPTNHKPIVKGSDNGIWRRLMLVPFSRNYEDDPHLVKDKHLGDKLEAEMAGILALIVRFAIEYQRVGLQAPVRVKEARDAYRSEMDLLSEWIEECCELDPSFYETISNLWSSWEIFAKKRGLIGYIRSSTALGRRLPEGRFPPGKASRGVRIRKGLRLRTSFTDVNLKTL